MAKHQTNLLAEHARILRQLRNAEAEERSAVAVDVEGRDLGVYDQLTDLAS